MFFHKNEYPSNFRYTLPNDVSREVKHLGEDVYRLSYSGKRWTGPASQAVLCESIFGKAHEGSLEEDGESFHLNFAGARLLSCMKGKGFGVLGKKWILNFVPEEGYRFYGLGEKNTGFEKTGLRTKFYNTDVWPDFTRQEMREGVTDPMYSSVPYLLVDTGRGWVGVLVNNGYPVFMYLQSNDAIAGGLHGAGPLPSYLSVGSTGGRPEIFFILGQNPRDVTIRLQRLVGTAPLPPLWALGYQQSRWGYSSFTDLDRLDKRFAAEDIPCDGLWLDIDYMDGFRVFSFNEKNFTHPKNQMEDLKKRGRRIVPILDPGVKAEESFDVYDEGMKKKCFCLNSEGLPFVGLVWPGETVFPDFSLPETREWWASRVKKFADNGITGIWLDMHDPSTGCVDPSEMLFGRGKDPHEAYHNQYCLGMQDATHKGLLASHPNIRPFLLSRSAFISSSKYTAVWTGDNWSNRHHLKQSLPVCLSLSLSGIPFCGPDVPGFGGDAEAGLAAAWFKACFLFPFLRNHSVKGSRDQEPWTFGEKTKAVLARYIKLRYRFLPYLYNLFIEQEKRGEPVLRPLMYEFPDRRESDLFFIGPSVLQAPVLEEGKDSRDLVLPGESTKWFSPSQGTWYSGGVPITVKETSVSTPLFLREGSAVPLLREDADFMAKDLSVIELHLFFSLESDVSTEYTYAFDDGESFGYRKGIRTSFAFTIQRTDSVLRVIVNEKSVDFLPGRISFVLYDRFEKIVLVDGVREEHLSTEKYTWDFLGKKLSCRRTRETVLTK